MYACLVESSIYKIHRAHLEMTYVKLSELTDNDTTTISPTPVPTYLNAWDSLTIAPYQVIAVRFRS